MQTHTPAVAFDGVVKRYPSFALQQLSFTLPKGEILGMVGPNGAGKSTCLALLMGFVPADEGSIEVLGQPVPENSAALKTDVAYVAETMRLYGIADLAWHMAFMKPMFPKWDDSYAVQLASKFELNIQQPIKTMSLGQRVKSTLLLALARRPRLLVLDEPSTGLDPIARHELTEQLMSVMLDEENSVLFSSQFTQDVERLCDSIAFLDNGALISHQDKESYLERWKRLRVTGPIEAVSTQSMLALSSSKQSHELIHTQFSASTLAELQAKGLVVEYVGPMTLEEIFIYQVRYHRQQSGAIV